jgi:hypothetical protein
MADPTLAEPRNPSSNGETAQESVDRMAGGMSNPPHPSAVAQGPSKPVGPNIHPVAKGVYGAPVGETVLH